MSQHLGVHKSTMLRLLSTMEAAGFVRRAPNNGRYALGPRLLEMAALVLSRLDVRTVARSWLEELSRRPAHHAGDADRHHRHELRRPLA